MVAFLARVGGIDKISQNCKIYWQLKYSFQFQDSSNVKYYVDGNKLQILKYSSYTVGIPFLVTMITLVVEHLPENYNGIRPGFGTTKCFFQDNMENLIFFHVLLMAVEFTNAALFIMVAIKLHKNWKFSKKVGMKQSSIKNGTNKTPTFKGTTILFSITSCILSFSYTSFPYNQWFEIIY